MRASGKGPAPLPKRGPLAIEGKEKQKTHHSKQCVQGNESEFDHDVQQDVGAEITLVGGVVHVVVDLAVLQDLLDLSTDQKIHPNL